jgi:CBS domain-containing protein
MELARNLKVESVSRLMPTPPHQIGSIRPVAEAVALMKQNKVGCLVVRDGNHLVGILTERDLMVRVIAQGRPLNTPVADCMTRDPVTVSEKESIRSAIERMQHGNYRHLPVLDEKNQLVGILSIKRIVHFLVEHFPNLVRTQPPKPKKMPPKREGA